MGARRNQGKDEQKNGKTVLECSGEKQNITFKHSIPTTCIPSRLHRVAECPDAVECFCISRRATILTTIDITIQLILMPERQLVEE